MARILYVITDLEIGGVPLHLHKLVRNVRERGFEVSVLSLAPAGPVGDMLRDDGVEVGDCAGQGGWDFRVIDRLAAQFVKQKPDIVHALLFHANIASRFAVKLAGIHRSRVICEIQTVELERKWHLWVDRLTYRGCRFTIGNSPSVIDHLATVARIPRDRLRLVCGGIDAKRVQQATPIDKAKLGLLPKEKLILWVGRLDPVKGLLPLLDAYARLDGSISSKLVLIGDGTYRETLAERIKALGLKERAILAGPRNDVPNLLKAADVFVFPSMTEGLPNALLEAMAAGCAIVTTDVPGCRDLIEHERTGLKVAYGDIAALHVSLDRLLKNERSATAFATAAKAEAETNWRIEDTYNAYLATYEETLRK